jgi:hypothetical protein
LVALLAASVWTIYKPTLDDAAKRREEAITDVTTSGPVEIDHVQWTLTSLQVYTRIPDDEGKVVDLDVPAGASIVVAMVDIKPLTGLKLNDGFPCKAELIDDQKNVWAEQSSVFGLALPTGCSDMDHPLTMNKSSKVMKIFVVPTSALPRLLGIITPVTGTPYPEKRVLLRP